MPTYGYHCDHCGAEFDVWQRMVDPPVSECPKCGKQPRRIFYPAGIVFKGAGFYKNDSRGTTSSDIPATPAPKPDTSTSPDAKPAAGAEPKPAPEKPAKETKKD